jgi:hypothetical protein
MTHVPRLAAAATAALLALAPLAAADDMKAEFKADGTNTRLLSTHFGSYGYAPRQTIFLEATGYRFRLPPVNNGAAQTGVYSYFGLSGDCEVVVTYELVNVPAPPKGYGSGVGLALDAGDDVGRASIQRLQKPGGEGGYALQTNMGKGDAAKEEYRSLPAKARRGKMGLRRVGKELVFLTAETPDGDLQEVDRLPFTDHTIRAVRFFADPGGSPSSVEVRVKDVTVRAGQITGGIPQKAQVTAGWWWLCLLLPPAGGLLYWFWHARRHKPEEGRPRAAPRRKARPKKV